MPEHFYMFGETHWGGCGGFGTTKPGDIKGIALGFRGRVDVESQSTVCG